MRRTIATLAAVAAAVAAFGGVAGSASADVAHPIVKNWSTPGAVIGQSCQSFQTYGVLGQYGAWGYFIDGCTAGRLYCPTPRGCSVVSRSTIDTFPHYGHRVTQNARIRVFNTGGMVRWYRDQSCAGVNTCTNQDWTFIGYGESASEQCNGVRESRPGLAPEAINLCRLELFYG